MGEDVGRYGGTYAVTHGLFEEFGPERIRDAALSELAFVGAGIGAALGGMRPIVEVMTVNFSLLALDQIVNSAATIPHMSGGQFAVPIVIRMATGGGRQLAAQHSHSVEGWYAHIPSLKILTPATVADARGMLRPALEDPDPALIFEHALLYGLEEELPSEPLEVDISSAAVRRPGADVSLITYGGTLGKTLAAADELAAAGVDAEVIDLRVLRPLDERAVLDSVARTHRAVVVDERCVAAAWQPRSARGSWKARSTSSTRRSRASAAPRCPCPTRDTSRKARSPGSRRSCARRGIWWRRVADFTMPSLGADMAEGTLLEWLVETGQRVERGDIVAVVDTDKAALDVETFVAGVVEELLVAPDTKVPLGTPFARIREDSGATSTAPPAPVAAPPAEAAPAREEHVAQRPQSEERVAQEGPAARHRRRLLTAQPPTAAARPPSREAAPPPRVSTSPGRVRVSPLARRLAAERGVDLAGLAGSGPGGAIRRADLDPAGAPRVASAATARRRRAARSPRRWSARTARSRTASSRTGSTCAPPRAGSTRPIAGSPRTTASSARRSCCAPSRSPLAPCRS